MHYDGGAFGLFKILGSKVEMGHIDHLQNHAKCLFSYRFYGLKMKLCHLTSMGEVPSSCSGLSVLIWTIL